MKLGILLRNEWTKARHWRGVRVPVLLFTVLMGLLFGGTYFSERSRGKLPPALPAAWADILGGISYLAILFVAVILMLLISSEFTWRTARQNVIDGLSREEWFTAKLMLLPLTALLFILLQVGIGGGFALAGTDFATATTPLIGRADLAVLGGVLLSVLGFGSLAFMIAFLVRSSGPAIALFFGYVVGEDIVKSVMEQFEALAGLVPHLPIIVFKQLLRRVLFDPAAAAELVQAALKAGRPAPAFPSTAGLVTLACGYIALFVGVAFVTYRRRDL